MALVVFIKMTNALDQFRVLAISAVTVGLIASTFYIATIRENKLSEEAAKYETAYKGVEVLATGKTKQGGNGKSAK